MVEAYILEEAAKLQIEVSENKDAIFFPIQVHRHLECCLLKC